MTVQRAEQPFGAHYGEDGLLDAEEEEEAHSPNFNEYNNAMMYANTQDNFQGKHDINFAILSSPNQTNTAYPTTQMTTEDNDDMVSYAAEEEIRVRQSNQQLLHNNNFNYQSSNQSSQIMHASPDGFSHKIGKELPPLHDDVNESQDSVVLQQSTQTSNQMKAMIQQYKEQPEPRLMQHRAAAQQQFLQPADTNLTSTGMHKRSQDRLPTANRNQHQQQQQVVKQMK